MSRVDVILDLIDGALDGHELQRTTEASYGDDLGEGACWRCAATSAPDSPSGLCAGCRAYLLQDSDVDPLPGPDTIGAHLQDLRDRVAEIYAAVEPEVQRWLDYPIIDEVHDWAADIDPEVSRLWQAQRRALSQIAAHAGVPVGLLGPGGESARYLVEGERLALAAAQEFEAAMRRVQEALDVPAEFAARALSEMMKIMSAPAAADAIIRLSNAFADPPLASLADLATLNPAPRNRAERRAERFDHAPTDMRPGQPAWTHRLNR